MTTADIDTVVALLAKGFAEWRDLSFWARAVQRLAERAVPEGLPRFGYVLEASGRLVGVLLLIVSEWIADGRPVRRCNVSSWYVEPDFRIYGTLLVRRALRHRDLTYLNVTPAPETWNILAAQGYVQYATGRAVMLPILARGDKRARVIDGRFDSAGLEPFERELLREHARWDCLALVCDTETGPVPFVFGLRRRFRVLPFAYLIYCRGLESLSACARPLGWALARRGIFLLVADGDRKVPGVPGTFETGHPKFFRGTDPPHAMDLAYTERAVFGT